MSHTNPDGNDLGGKMKPISLLHVYGQDFWHCEAWVVGNKRALLALREAIDKALADQKGDCGQGVAQTMTSDGEHYEVVVRLEDGPWDGKYWRNAAMPYFDATASAGNDQPNVVWPHQRDPRYHERVANGEVKAKNKDGTWKPKMEPK